MRTELGERYEAFAEALARPVSTAIRVNRLKCSADVVARAAGWQLTPVPRANDGYYIEDPDVRPGKCPLHDAGAYYIQEPSAMAVAAAAGLTGDEIVLDLCAAPGGKTTAIAALLKGHGLLISNEPVPKRAEVLSENVERMGLANTIVTNEYPDALAKKFPGFFTKIFVDAPCSGEGMFGKEPEAIPAWSVQTVSMCAQRQHDILEAADTMLSPGGALIYSTCTFAPEEDELQMRSFIKEHPAYDIISEDKFYPHEIRGCGHYVCVLAKAGRIIDPACRRFGRSHVRREQLAAWQEFAAQMLTDKTVESSGKGLPRKLKSAGDNNGRFISYGDNLYLVPFENINLDGLRVPRPGLQLGSLNHNRFIPSHALALSLNPDEVTISYDLTLEQAAAYIRGETILCPPELKGWLLVTVCGISLAWGKAGGGMIKNHYPKGLRHN